jgi:hypothetical protein
MDSYGEYPTARQELDEVELGRRPSEMLRFGQDVLWHIGIAVLLGGGLIDRVPV